MFLKPRGKFQRAEQVTCNTKKGQSHRLLKKEVAKMRVSRFARRTTEKRETVSSLTEDPTSL